MSEHRTATAYFVWSLGICCPHCGHDIELSDSDDYQRFLNPLIDNKWDELKDVKIVCDFCGDEIYIKEIQS